jgi:hypothetical protein
MAGEMGEGRKEGGREGVSHVVRGNIRFMYRRPILRTFHIAVDF